jgi:hypothetical protein
MQIVQAPANGSSATKRTIAVASSIPNSEVLANQVRVSGGYTHAPGLLNPNTGRMMWARMCGVMGVPRFGLRSHRERMPPVSETPFEAASEVEWPDVLGDLSGTRAGRLYMFLLSDECCGDAPTNDFLGAVLGVSGNQASRDVQALERRNLIKVLRTPGRGRSILIVENDKVLKSAREPGQAS